MIQSKKGILKGLKRNPKGEAVYDSLLERDYMFELENLGGVASWTKDHGIRIPYKIFGIISRHYLPDFLVTFADGSKEIHETKGSGFLSWVSTHAKRRAGDIWCHKNGMVYRFIENSKGALFAANNSLSQLEKAAFKRKEKVSSFDDLK